MSLLSTTKFPKIKKNHIKVPLLTSSAIYWIKNIQNDETQRIREE